jgi:ornithine decarboxylase
MKKVFGFSQLIASPKLRKIARQAPDARVFCRILTSGEGAEWPLSRKFGCDPDMAMDVLIHAHFLGLHAYGLSFHVGSQMLRLDAWNEALKQCADIFRTLSEQGIQLSMVNLGGGFPTQYHEAIAEPKAFGRSILDAIRLYFGNRIPETIIEPGRAMVGNAGAIQAEIVLISEKSYNESIDKPSRWVYLDIGKFGGLAETMDEAIRYPITTAKDHDPKSDCILAGPTCDSMDVLYEKTPYALPISLSIGDQVLIEATGAYTTTYASVGFNGFEPLASYVI